MVDLSTQPILPELERMDDSGVEIEDPGYDEIDWEPFNVPFDPTSVRISTVPTTVDMLVSRMRHNEIDLSPGFQRHGGLWKDGEQSRLIESLLIKIPLPAFYMDGADEGKWLVVDGLQRLTTFKRFVIDQSLRLTGLEYLIQLNGKKFDDIPRGYQRRILEAIIVVFLIEKGTHPAVKYNIFRRINTGGLPLSSQEIRHTLNPGPVIGLLQELAESTEFLQATSSSIRSERMADREFALRFLAFVQTPYQEYRTKDFNLFLYDAMRQLNNLPSKEYDNLQASFRRAMTAANQIFGVYAFRKYSESRLLPLNKALFEAISINLSKLDDKDLQTLVLRKTIITEHLRKLLSDKDFDSAISTSTDSTAKVHLRFQAIEKIIQETLS